MDQKNTIVKCTANPNCLFNHNGICDNYVITIGADGSCQAYVETEQKTCHPDCIHFDDGDMLTGPICLFKHPEPPKDFYEGMPCEYYHSTNYTRGQRAKCNVFDDMMDIDDKHLGEPVTVKMKVAELNKTNKNKTIIKIPPMSKEDQAIMNEIGYVPPKEEDQMCWYCDHGKHGKCKFPAKPMKDSNGKCCRFTSTGGNR